MLALKIALAVSSVNGREFALEYGLEEIARTTGRLEKSRVDALGLTLDKVEHVFHHPLWSEHFAVIGDSLARANERFRG
jgi:hypothetical protein